LGDGGEEEGQKRPSDRKIRPCSEKLPFGRKGKRNLGPQDPIP
jgi:hypothetical protein